MNIGMITGAERHRRREIGGYQCSFLALKR